MDDSPGSQEFCCVWVPSTGSLTDSGPSDGGCDTWLEVISSSPHVINMLSLTLKPFTSSTSYGNGPVTLTMVPAIHLCFLVVKFSTYALSFRAPSWSAFCLACLSSTLPWTVGKTKSNDDRSFCFMSSSHGATPVIELGVRRYLKRNLDNLSWTAFPGVLLSPCLTVWTACLAWPLLDGWYGAEVTCLIPFFCVKSLNSLLVNEGPLSVTIICGSLYVVCKHRSQGLNSFLWWHRRHYVCVKPLRRGIHDDKVSVSQVRSSEIEMNASPRLSRPLPWVKWGWWRRCPTLDTLDIS